MYLTARRLLSPGDVSPLSRPSTPMALEDKASWNQVGSDLTVSHSWDTTNSEHEGNKEMCSVSYSTIPRKLNSHTGIDPASSSTLYAPNTVIPTSSLLPFRPANDHPISTPGSDVPSSFLQRKTIRFLPAWTVALLALGTTSVTVWYSHHVMVDTTELPHTLQLSPGLTVLAANRCSGTHALGFGLQAKRCSATSFLAMSRATPITGVLYLCRVQGSHQIWALQRILSYIVTVGLSLILIVNVTFRRVYTPYTGNDGLGPTHSVVGGLAPLSTEGFAGIDMALISLLAATYSVAFITDPRFVTKVAPVTCSASDTNCMSLLLPGGMEVVREYEKGPGQESFSQSLYTGNFSGNYDTIVINDAPAYQLEYNSIEAVDPDFTWDRNETGNDCTMFGQAMGWTICPEPLFGNGACQTDQSWTDNVKWNTTVSAFRRRATVAYDRANISILSVESVSDLMPGKVKGSDYWLYANLVMAPIDKTMNWTESNDKYSYSAVRFAFQYGLGFLLRFYMSEYSTFKDGGVYLLRSFVSVPFQFATSMRQFGNMNRMPLENSRAIIDVWTVWTFAWLAFPLIFYCAGFLFWMGLWGPHTPNLSVFPEINITSKSSVHMEPDFNYSSDMDPHLEMTERTLEDLGRLTRSRGMGDGQFLQTVKNIRGRRVHCGSLPGRREGDELIVLLTEEARRLRCLNKQTIYT
ncbi:hypothetical protein B0H66DRAFT_538318 [Apodospora peruviana]|uniref:Uncharacterized protein n=1 Tax=Apodospora peruviana TaxID=516989 RepID=A0AAE0M036_9PEZI|nr:hypothetical protein B0H66DRAFT_538318 [Apodospora peruviana]